MSVYDNRDSHQPQLQPHTLAVNIPAEVAAAAAAGAAPGGDGGGGHAGGGEAPPPYLAGEGQHVTATAAGCGGGGGAAEKSAVAAAVYSRYLATAAGLRKQGDPRTSGSAGDSAEDTVQRDQQRGPRSAPNGPGKLTGGWGTTEEVKIVEDLSAGGSEEDDSDGVVSVRDGEVRSFA